MLIQSINPLNGELAYSYASFSKEEIDEKLEKSDATFELWSRTTFEERKELVLAIAHVLQHKKKYLARVMAEEMGKLFKDGIAEIEKCVSLCEYYAEYSESFLADEVVETEASKSYYCYRPLGALLAIMPWNFPFWQVFRCAIPTIMAGNTVLLRHSSLVPECAMLIEKIFHEAGAPDGLFQTLLVEDEWVEKCIAHPAVKAVSFTGSTRVGKIIASISGKYLKRTVLELGGSDPYIILEDADISHAVKTCVASRIVNSGQSCIAAKRFIVVQKVYDEFLNKFIEEMGRLSIGSPTADRTDIGPLASIGHRENLHDQVQESIALGAKVLLGGHRPNNAGAYYAPTILVDVAPGMPAFDEELFGPVAAIIKAEDEVDAIMLANQSSYGLGAAIFSRDIDYAETVGRELIDVGAVFINEAVRSDVRLPFGGVKQSGYGRELSKLGIREFCNIKTVYIANSAK